MTRLWCECVRSHKTLSRFQWPIFYWCRAHHHKCNFALSNTFKYNIYSYQRKNESHFECRVIFNVIAPVRFCVCIAVQSSANNFSYFINSCSTRCGTTKLLANKTYSGSSTQRAAVLSALLVSRKTMLSSDECANLCYQIIVSNQAWSWCVEITFGLCIAGSTAWHDMNSHC